MEGWRAAGVRTERIISGDVTFDAPLVIMESGEILPLILRFPEVHTGADVAPFNLQDRHSAAESLIDSMHVALSVWKACRRFASRKEANRVLAPALELISDGVRLYRRSGRDDEVRQQCVLVIRQLRMALLALRLKKAVFKAIKVDHPRVFYRKFTSSKKRDQEDVSSKDKYGSRPLVTESKKHSKRRGSKSPKDCRVYEIIQAVASVGMPGFDQLDQDARPPREKRDTAVEFLEMQQASDSLEDLCEGHLPDVQGSSLSSTDHYADAYRGEKPHVCCALPQVVAPSGFCCETELHNLCLTKWEPWGVEERSVLAAIGILLLNEALTCERVLCYGLSPSKYAELRVQKPHRHETPPRTA